MFRPVSQTVRVASRLHASHYLLRDGLEGINDAFAVEVVVTGITLTCLARQVRDRTRLIIRRLLQDGFHMLRRHM